MVAAARARETEPDPLIRDPYARLLVNGADVGTWGRLPGSGDAGPDRRG